ncbi:MAG: hypothetical protein J7L12_03765 [Desulfurococcales archaeon]|nr:hypothetical protein [Desulfurococcales archaeon]
MGGDVEDRLKRLEDMLARVLSRLESIERYLRALGVSDDVLSGAFKLVTTFSLPATAALEASRRAIEVVRVLGGIDSISRSVIEVLSSCEELSISEITRRVRALRGRASRRIIRDRLKVLEEKGVVVNVGGRKPRYVLKTCLKKSEG